MHLNDSDWDLDILRQRIDHVQEKSSSWFDLVSQWDDGDTAREHFRHFWTLVDCMVEKIESKGLEVPELLESLCQLRISSHRTINLIQAIVEELS